MLLPQQIIIHFLVIDVFQMLQKAKTHAIPLGNHGSQQKLTQTMENRLALTKTQNVGIFRFIPVCSALFECHSASFRCHSGSFWYIPVPFLFISFHSGVIPPHSGIFRYIPFHSVPFLCLVTPVYQDHQPSINPPMHYQHFTVIFQMLDPLNDRYL